MTPKALSRERINNIFKSECDSCKSLTYFWELYNRSHYYWLCVDCAITHDLTKENKL